MLVLILLQSVVPTPSSSASSVWSAASLIIASIAVAIAAANFVVTHLWPRWKTYRDKRSLKNGINAPFLTDTEMEENCRFYVEPFVQNIDPMGSEEPRAVAGLKKRLFETLDEMLGPQSYDRYIILLADAGMGKTSALINYTVRHIRRYRQQYKIVLIQLHKTDALDSIKGVVDKRNTILLLDAFDEDSLAIKDHRTRLDQLMNAADGFRSVLVTCRTQFFRTDEEIPKQTGILKVTARRAGESAKYTFIKLYLSPFTSEQTKKYIKKRFPLSLFRPDLLPKRRDALRMADQIPDLLTRPLLLTHIDSIVENPTVRYSFEAYEVMVQAWLKREEGFIEVEDQLERFSLLLSAHLVLNQEGLRVPRDELVKLAAQWDIPVRDTALSDYKFSTRSLLNRDADGNYKFAHLSIMEYLYVRYYNSSDEDRRTELRGTVWTDTMRNFYWEMFERSIVDHRKLPLNDRSVYGDYLVDLSQVGFLTELALHGSRLLRVPEIVGKRWHRILATATALCARLIDPFGAGDPVITLLSLRGPNVANQVQALAIHHQGQLLSVESADIERYERIAAPWLLGDYIPDIDDPDYYRYLGSLLRIEKDWCQSIMPIKHQGALVGIFLGETSRQFRFENCRQPWLIEVLGLIGQYLHKHCPTDHETS